MLRGGQVWATDAHGASRQVTKLPAEVAAQLRAAEVAPDGRLLLVTVSGGAEHWLLDRPAAVPQPLPAPPQQYGKGRWTFLSAVWPAPRQVVLLYGNSGRGLAERLGDPSAGADPTWTLIDPGKARLLSLSPDGRQAVLAARRVGSSGFAPQVAVRLQHLFSPRMTTALSHLGVRLPVAALWSPDGGTLAISVRIGAWLSRSRAGALCCWRRTVSFRRPSASTALAGLSGGACGRLEIHVLALHGEADHAFPAPDGGSPLWLGWTRMANPCSTWRRRAGRRSGRSMPPEGRRDRWRPASAAPCCGCRLRADAAPPFGGVAMARWGSNGTGVAQQTFSLAIRIAHLYDRVGWYALAVTQLWLTQAWGFSTDEGRTCER